MILDLIVIGLGIALSPVSLTPFLLILTSKRGVRNGAAFMLGWLVSIAAVVVVTLTVTQNNPPKPSSAPSVTALVIKLLIGLVLIFFGVRQRRRMGTPKPPKKTPRWETGIDNMSMWFAFALAPLTQAWGMIAAGVTVIVNADLGSWQDDLALILFCLVASSVVITLELFATFRPERAQRFTTAIRSWIEAHTDQVIVVLFLGLGLYLVASSTYYLATA
jgi:threonine/homoserine/homoserine lactone efflux protein